jgi:hypothetical protein
MPSVLRESTDASAPILIGNSAGSLITLLKGVLVDGYGTKAPLGWGLEFDDQLNNICVLRPGAGVRPFVRIDDGIVSTGIQSSQVIAYESMADINTGFFPCPPETAGDYRYINKCDLNSSRSVPWKIIGDERGFWLLIRTFDTDGTATDQGSLYHVYYIGDYTCYNLNNNYNFMTILTNKTNTNGYLNTLENQIHYLLRDPDTIEPNSVNSNIKIEYFFSTTSWASIGTSCPNSSPKGGRYFYEPLKVVYGNSKTIGIVPGFLSMLWQTTESDQPYKQSANERAVFYDIGVNKKIIVFPIRNRTNDYNLVVSRGSIIIGDGFRDAY